MKLINYKLFPVLVISLVSFFWFWFFISGAQKLTSGVWTAPLDDTFIHFQYAKQIAQGHWFRYYPDAPITTGASSFLYPIILAVGYTLGFTGLKLLWWAYGLGVFGLIITGYLCFLLARQYKLPRYAALWLSLLVISSGWLLWGYFSGMEIALQSTFLLLLLWSAVKENQAGELRLVPLWASLLALTRPEGFLAAAIVAAWIFWQKFWHKKSIQRWYLMFLPIILFVGQLIFYRLGTGQWGSNTMILKLWWYNILPGGHFSPLINKIIDLLIVIFSILPKAIIVFSDDVGLIFYFGLVAFFVGAVLARRDEPQDSPFPLSVIWLIIFSLEFLAILNIYGAVESANRRYFIFLAPLAIFFTVYLFWTIGAAISKRLPPILLGILTIFTLRSNLFFRQIYAFDNENIWQMHFQVADWLRRHTAAETIIGMNDVGVIPYLTDRHIFDMMGLVTNGVARLVHQGPAAYYHYLVKLPRTERPAYFAVFPAWFLPDGEKVESDRRSILKLFGQPIKHFSVSNPTAVPYTAKTIFEANFPHD